MAGGHLVLLVLGEDPLPPGAGRHHHEVRRVLVLQQQRERLPGPLAGLGEVVLGCTEVQQCCV